MWPCSCSRTILTRIIPNFLPSWEFTKKSAGLTTWSCPGATTSTCTRYYFEVPNTTTFCLLVFARDITNFHVQPVYFILFFTFFSTNLMIQVMKHNNTTLPPQALFVIRYHSFYGENFVFPTRSPEILKITGPKYVWVMLLRHLVISSSYLTSDDAWVPLCSVASSGSIQAPIEWDRPRESSVAWKIQVVSIPYWCKTLLWVWI